jgi:hypothetical protein
MPQAIRWWKRLSTVVGIVFDLPASQTGHDGVPPIALQRCTRLQAPSSQKVRIQKKSERTHCTSGARIIQK